MWELLIHPSAIWINAQVHKLLTKLPEHRNLKICINYPSYGGDKSSLRLFRELLVIIAEVIKILRRRPTSATITNRCAMTFKHEQRQVAAFGCQERQTVGQSSSCISYKCYCWRADVNTLKVFHVWSREVYRKKILPGKFFSRWITPNIAELYVQIENISGRVN